MLDTNNLSFREDLKLARKAAGFSGAALSKAIGISAGMVSRYESHNRNDGVLPGADTLKKINEVLFATTATTEKPATKSAAHEPKSEQEIADSLPLSTLVKAIKKHGAKEIVF